MSGLRPCLLEQIKHALFAQILPELLHADREFEQLKEVLFAHVNAALIESDVVVSASSYCDPRIVSYYSTISQ